MPIFDAITTGMKDAMKAKDAARLGALRGIRAAFLTEMKKDNSDTLPDETCVAILRKLEKQRREAIEIYEKAGRTEQAAQEKGELAVIGEFLPSLADEGTTRRWVREAIDTSGASSPGDMGRVMGAVMKAHRGEVDGKLAQRIATEILADG